jgi:hypothetical protein
MAQPAGGVINQPAHDLACLVGTDMDYSPQMERLLQMGEVGRPKQRRIMELNRNTKSSTG